MTTVAPVNQRASVQGFLVEDMDDQPPGALEFYTAKDRADAGILFMCPCGCGEMFGVAVHPDGGSPAWTWDGNREAPTLTPSILIYQLEKGTGARVGEHWHGFLTAGHFKSC